MFKTPTVGHEWVLNTLRVLSMLTLIGVNVSDAYYRRRIRQLPEEMGLTERL